QNVAVHDVFDALNLFRLEGFEVGKVETQAIFRHKRTGLADVRAEDLAESVVEKVSRGVVTLDVSAEAKIDAEKSFGSRRKIGGSVLCLMQIAAVGVLDCIDDFDALAVDFGDAPVSDLSAHFGVEGSAVEDEECL